MKRTGNAWRFAALIVVAIALGPSCGGGSGGDAPYTHSSLVEANAWDGDPPPGAQEVAPQTFGAWLDSGRIVLVTPDDMRREREMAEADLEDLKDRAAVLYASRPEVVARHTVEPFDDLPDFEALPDGTWRHHLPDGQHVALQGPLAAYRDLVHAHETFHSQANQATIYETLYARLTPAYRSENGLPDPADVATYTYDEVLDLNATLVADWRDFSIPLTVKRPAGYPDNALLEEGASTNIDRAAYAAPTGLAARVDYPLEWYVTSIKRQGRRGSCSAFGITAAIETWIAQQQGRWVNLSEQMLYNRAKMAWSEGTYGDNYSTSGLMWEMVFFTFVYPWERSWDYNLSLERIDHEAQGFYERSCWANADGTQQYAGEHCSEANHQATALITNLNGLSFTAFVNPESDVPPDSGFHAGVPNQMMNPGVIGPAWAIAMLALGYPVVISVTMPDGGLGGMSGPDSVGIIPWSPTEPPGRGGHAMLMVAFIPNADLPAGIPPAPSMGYFITKNSWGNFRGDGGFLYLSATWLMRWCRGMYTVQQVYER